MEAVTKNLLLFLSKGKAPPSTSSMEPYLNEICVLAAQGPHATTSIALILEQLLCYLVRLLSDPAAMAKPNTPTLAKMICGACAFLVDHTDVVPVSDSAFYGVIHVGYIQLRHLQDTRSSLHGFPFPITVDAWNKFHVNDCFLWLSVTMLLKPVQGLFHHESPLPDVIVCEFLSIVEFVLQHALKTTDVAETVAHVPFIHLELPRPGKVAPMLQVPFAVLLSHVLEVLRHMRPLREHIVLVVTRTLTAVFLMHIAGLIDSSAAEALDRIYRCIWEALTVCTTAVLHPSLQYRITHLLFLVAVTPGSHLWIAEALNEQLQKNKWADVAALERNVAMSLYEVHSMLNSFSPSGTDGADAELRLWILFSSAIRESQFPITGAFLSKLVETYQHPTLLCYTFITQCFISLADPSDATPMGATVKDVAYAAQPMAQPNPDELRQGLLETMSALEWARPIFFYSHMCLRYCRTTKSEDEAFSEFTGTLGACVDDRGLSHFVSAYILQFCTSKTKPKFATTCNRLIW